MDDLVGALGRLGVGVLHDDLLRTIPIDVGQGEMVQLDSLVTLSERQVRVETGRPALPFGEAREVAPLAVGHVEGAFVAAVFLAGREAVVQHLLGGGELRLERPVGCALRAPLRLAVDEDHPEDHAVAPPVLEGDRLVVEARRFAEVAGRQRREARVRAEALDGVLREAPGRNRAHRIEARNHRRIAWEPRLRVSAPTHPRADRRKLPARNVARGLIHSRGMTHRAAAILLLFASACVVPVADGLDADAGDPPWMNDAAMEVELAAWDEPHVVEPGAAQTAGGEVVEAPAADEEPTTPTEVTIVEDIDEGAVLDIVGLPAISRDGRVVAMMTYDDAYGVRRVSFMGARTGRPVRQIDVDAEDPESDAPARALHDAFDAGDYVPLVSLEHIWNEDDDSGMDVTFLGDDLSVRQEGRRVVAWDDAGDVVATIAVRPRVPDGVGRNLMAPEMVDVPMVAWTHTAFVSQDGRHLVTILAACDCACDINPYARATVIER